MITIYDFADNVKFTFYPIPTPYYLETNVKTNKDQIPDVRVKIYFTRI